MVGGECDAGDVSVNPIHFSSATDEWSTPDDFFAKVEAEFGPFDLDPCATPANAKAPKFYTYADNGLTLPWHGRVWCNPPYGRAINEWIKKAWYATSETVGVAQAELVVMLLPARPDTRVWHEIIFPHAAEVRFIRGRLKFGGAKNSAPFPSALVIFRRKD